MKLDEIFNEISTQMKSDFAKAKQALNHAGLKGRANEEILRIFLKQYLPKNLDISTGILVDSNGNKSKQLDIIVSDAAKTPILFQSGEVRVIPVECAYAVIEVKAFLDKTELEKCYANMDSVKSLEKKAFYRSNGAIKHTKNLYGKGWDHWPINYFVFAFDSNSLNSIYENMNTVQNNEHVHKRIDCICVLEKGVIANKQPDGLIHVLPMEGSSLVYSETTKPLLFFYTLISSILNQADMDYFQFPLYLGDIKF